MPDLRAGTAYVVDELLIPILVMAVILVGVGIVVRAVMGRRFGSPEIPSGSLWCSFERIVMRKVEHDRARSSGLQPTEKTLDRD